MQDKKAIACRAMEIMSSGTREEFEEVVHPEFFNREAKVCQEPPEALDRGPQAAWVTAEWLRTTFADMRHEIREVVAEGDLVVVHCVTSGRHVGPMPLYDQQGAVKEVLQPTGKSFAVTQTHWLRIVDGKCIEHWANRDDIGTAEQLGWLSPSQTYVMSSSEA